MKDLDDVWGDPLPQKKKGERFFDSVDSSYDQDLDAWGYDLPDLDMSVLQHDEVLNENTEKLKDKFILKVSGKNQNEIMSLLNELQDRGFEVEVRNE